MYALRRDLKLIVSLLDHMRNQSITPDQYDNFSRRLHRHLDNNDMMSGDEYDGFFEMTDEEEGNVNQQQLADSFAESVATALEGAVDDAS